MQSNNKVSILIPVKNEEKYIQESIDSILAQDYSNYEVLIVDDGSTDDTMRKLDKYKNIDNIRIFPTKGVGKNAAFNLAFKNAIGNYICYFAGDDIMLPNSLSLRIAEISKSNEKKVLLLSKLKTLSNEKKHDGIILPKNIDKGNMTGGSLMFKRELSNNIFPIPENLANEDLWSNLYCSIFDIKTIHFPEVTYLLRIHENNSYSNFKTYKQRSEAMHKREIAYGIFLEKYRDKLNEKKIEVLEIRCAAESLRYNKNILSLIFLKGLNSKEKLRVIFYGNEFLYNIRVKLHRLFSGR